MDLDAHLRALLAVEVGGEVAPGVILRDVSSSNGWRLTLDDGGREIHVELEPLAPGRRAAVSTRRLGVSYRAAGTLLDPARGKALATVVAERVAPREDEVLARIAAEASVARSHDDGGARVREVHVTRALEPMGTPDERFWGLSPYAGCVVGCRFCYAGPKLRPLRRLQLLEDAPWGSYVDARVNIAELLARELDEVRPHAVKFCPILSDPYQAIEARLGLTRACLEVLGRATEPPTVLVLTRTTLVARDAALLASIPRAHAGVSLPTVDDAVRRHFEPRAASVDERLGVLRTLRDAGVQTFAIVQPILPGSLDALADALAATVSSVRIDVLHGVEGATREFSDPRYAASADPEWQADAAARLAELCAARGVAVWTGELPPT